MSHTSDATGMPWTRCKQCGYPDHGSIPCDLANPTPAAQGADARDAARYRWLREQRDVEIGACYFLPISQPLLPRPYKPADLDAAIDAAISQAAKEKP